MPTFRLDVAYDGSGFRGSARNRGVRTVQGELEAALARITGHDVETVFAGRTDAGVHAGGNVVAFDSPQPIELDAMQRSVNSMLGPEIVVKAASVAPDGFSPRFDATARVYRYVVDPAPVPDPFLRWTAWHPDYDLDVEAMNRASTAFVGEHDFASLCRKAEGRSTERRVDRAIWAEEGGLLVFEVEASSFCHQMVRSMVALCVDVGRGQVDPAAVPGIIAAKDRHAARGVAPPHGLTLEAVRFESR